MTTRTIDITPTWAGSLPVLLMAYEHGTPKGRQLAVEELTRMARLADERVATRTQADAVKDAITAEAVEIANLKRAAGQP